MNVHSSAQRSDSRSHQLHDQREMDLYHFGLTGMTPSNSVAETPHKDPFRLPIAVRTASTMTTKRTVSLLRSDHLPTPRSIRPVSPFGSPWIVDSQFFGRKYGSST